MRDDTVFCTNCGARQTPAQQPAAQGWQNPARASSPPQPSPSSGYPPEQPYPQQSPAAPQGQSQQGYAPPGNPPQQPYYPQSQPFYSAAPRTRAGNALIPSLLMIVAGAVMAVSPFLPWVRAAFQGQSQTGSFKEYIDDTDKNVGLLIVVFVIAAAIIVGGVLRYLGKLDPALFTAWAAITGIAGVGEAVYQYIQYKDTKDDIGDLPSGASFNLTFGFYAVVLSALLCFVAIAADRMQARRT